MVIAALFAAAALLADQPGLDSSAPAPPPDAAPKAAPKKAAAAKDSDVVCENTQITGSRFTQNLCHTRAEWEQLRREAEDARQSVDIYRNH